VSGRVTACGLARPCLDVVPRACGKMTGRLTRHLFG
jgi:hypothetical protein